jgi:hypothetical protein
VALKQRSEKRSWRRRHEPKRAAVRQRGPGCSRGARIRTTRSPAVVRSVGRRAQTPATAVRGAPAGSASEPVQSVATVTSSGLRLTRRSSGHPAACQSGHQAQGLRPILRLLSSLPRRWVPLSFNVRPHVSTCALHALRTRRPNPGRMSFSPAVPSVASPRCTCKSSHARRSFWGAGACALGNVTRSRRTLRHRPEISARRWGPVGVGLLPWSSASRCAVRPNPAVNRTPCGSPRLARHFILGQARSATRRRLP